MDRTASSSRLEALHSWPPVLTFPLYDMGIMKALSLNPKAIAWAIVIVSVVSLPLHALISHRAGSTLSGLSFVAFGLAVALGLLQSPSDTKRFLPALCALVMSVLHSLLVYGS